MEARKFVPESWRSRLAMVEEVVGAIEAEAERKVKELASRKEVEEIVAKLRAREFAAKAEKTGAEVLKKLEELPEKAMGRMSPAAQAQVSELAAQVKGLSRKLERFSTKWTGKAPSGATEEPSKPTDPQV